MIYWKRLVEWVWRVVLFILFLVLVRKSFSLLLDDFIFWVILILGWIITFFLGLHLYILLLAIFAFILVYYKLVDWTRLLKNKIFSVFEFCLLFFQEIFFNIWILQNLLIDIKVALFKRYFFLYFFFVLIFLVQLI